MSQSLSGLEAATLQWLGLMEDTQVVFTSDHGEMAGAHGLFGKGTMYEESLHVPLIVRAPGQASGRRTSQLAATIDLMPTLVDYAGADRPQEAEGISLRAQIEGGPADSGRTVISEFQNFCASTQSRKLVTKERTLIPAALYHIGDDPFELENRLHDPDCASIQSALQSALTRWHNRVVAGVATEPIELTS